MNFEDELERRRRLVAILDDRPRLLGMFRSWTTRPHIYEQYKGFLPRFGFGEHLHMCRECEKSGGSPHPKLHTIFAYVRIGLTLHTISWPTWFGDAIS